MSEKTPGQAAYEAFMASAGLPVTPESYGDWPGMDDYEHAHWEAAASAAIKADDTDVRELLKRGADALWACAKAALTVKPTLDEPYPDDPRWTPYTRWVERPAHEAHDAAMAIRKHLKTAGSNS